MCTAINYKCKNHYFGRNLDLEYGYGELVAVTPENYEFVFRNGSKLSVHYAMIGMAAVDQGYPLYFDATNSKGLSIAGLNFPGNAVYLPFTGAKTDFNPYELIPWILGQCANVLEAAALLREMRICDLPYREELPLTPLHWIISDSRKNIVAEPMSDGLHLYDDPHGVLTNNPPLPYHLHHLAEFMHLSPEQTVNRMTRTELAPYSNGMGAMGLPGDFSSGSRFVRAVFLKENAVADGSEVAQFFHLLSGVSMPRGGVRTKNGYQITRYSSCCDTKNGIYYYTTYDNSRPSAVAMHNCDLQCGHVITFPLRQKPDILWQN